MTARWGKPQRRAAPSERMTVSSATAEDVALLLERRDARPTTDESVVSAADSPVALLLARRDNLPRHEPSTAEPDPSSDASSDEVAALIAQRTARAVRAAPSSPAVSADVVADLIAQRETRSIRTTVDPTPALDTLIARRTAKSHPDSSHEENPR